MSRKLFCEISPLTYKISVARLQMKRRWKDAWSSVVFAREKQAEKLPFLIYAHESVIRRKLGNVNEKLQNNKAVNLGIAAPKVNMVVIKPGETFSFWKLVGSTDAKKGYLEGLQISRGKTTSCVGGGMCQFTNLIHWMVLHSPLEIVEQHHHDQVDLFPDDNRKVPFGTGTSIFYNYVDYRFYNPTDQIFQLVVYTTEETLCGELRSNKELPYTYDIRSVGEQFVKEEDGIYRCGEVYRTTINNETQEVISRELLRKNHARVLYEIS